MGSVPKEPGSNPPPQRTTPFRFKRKRPPSPSDETPHKQCSRSSSPFHNHRPGGHRHHHHHRSRRRPQTPPDDPALYDDTYLPNARSRKYSSPSTLDPDIAFRESLFDALADDEGAAFWEGVYGQPIHNYSLYKADYEDNNDLDKPKLERMSDEEYVSYVRSKMWEKSHQYVFEERRRREEERKKRKLKDEERRRWQASVEESLHRGENRRKRDRWFNVWTGYLDKWESTFTDPATTDSKKNESMKERISWPVESGKWEDVSRGEIERFFGYASEAAAARDGREVDLVGVLKKERVRWHPDKMQQRAGTGGIDGGTMKIVTAVFQVVDALWAESKGKVRNMI